MNQIKKVKWLILIKDNYLRSMKFERCSWWEWKLGSLQHFFSHVIVQIRKLWVIIYNDAYTNVLFIDMMNNLQFKIETHP